VPLGVFQRTKAASGGERRTKGKGGVLGRLWSPLVDEISHGDGRGWWWISWQLEPKRGEEREGVGADSVQPSRGKKGGPMPRTLEQGEGPGAGRWWSGRQGRAHGGGSLVWRVGQPGKRKEIGPEKEMGPALEE
jgi:hypothetical protein